MKWKWKALTSIPAGGLVPVTQLAEVDMLKQKRKLKNLFKEHAPAAVGLMCVDVSLNVDRATKQPMMWQVHFHGIICNVEKRALRSMRDSPAFVSTGRGLFVEQATNPIGQLAYMSKANFFRRVTYVDMHGMQNTRTEPLSVLEEVELAGWLSKHKAHTRFMTIREFK